MQVYGTCSVCGSLPDELKVNYGREERYPEAYNKLLGLDNDKDSIYKYCPSCKTYFFCEDYPQEYGSGNNAEEIITRFSPEQSRYLDTMLNANEFYSPGSNEVDQIIHLIPRHQLIFALYGLCHHASKAFEQFIPAVVKELGKYNDMHWWNLIKDYYIDKNSKRADKVLNYFYALNKPDKEYIKKMIEYCKQLASKPV